jgi:hypothetical protein
MGSQKAIKNLKKSIANAEIATETLENINECLADAQQLISNNKLVNINEYYNYVVSQLKTIDTDILKFIKEEEIKSMIKGSSY